MRSSYELTFIRGPLLAFGSLFTVETIENTSFTHRRLPSSSVLSKALQALRLFPASAPSNGALPEIRVIFYWERSLAAPFLSLFRLSGEGGPIAHHRSSRQAFWRYIALCWLSTQRSCNDGHTLRYLPVRCSSWPREIRVTRLIAVTCVNFYYTSRLFKFRLVCSLHKLSVGTRRPTGFYSVSLAFWGSRCRPCLAEYSAEREAYVARLLGSGMSV